MVWTTITQALAGPIYRTKAPQAADIDKEHLRKAVSDNLAQLSSSLTEWSVDQMENQPTLGVFRAWQAQGKRFCVDHSKAKNWWDKEVLGPVVRIQNKFCQLLVMAPSQENIDQFNYWNDKFRSKVSQLRQVHWRTFLASTDSILVFQAFQFTKPRSGGGILPLKGPEGSITSDKANRANLLFKGTSVVESNCDLSNIPPNEDSTFVVFPPITKFEVKGVLD
jgi:hypothetical protein